MTEALTPTIKTMALPTGATAAVPGEAYQRPPNPGPTPKIPGEADAVEANIQIQEHAELLCAYHLANNVDKACVKGILEAFDGGPHCEICQ